MTKEELLNQLKTIPYDSELLVNLGDRYAEIKDIKVSYSERSDGKKPYIIINIYK